MKKLLASFILAALTLSGGFTAQAQMPGGPQTGVNAAMTKLFGKNTAFSAKAEVRMLDKAQKQTMSMPMLFALLDGKIRVEMDMTQIKSKEMPADMAGTLKQMGMDKMITIVRPEKKTTLVVYPALQGYAEEIGRASCRERV